MNFKVGDRIELTGAVYALSKHLGKEGTINSFFDNGEYAYVEFDDGERDSVRVDSDITLVPEVVTVTVEVPSPSVKAQIEAIETALATLKSTIGL